MPAAVDIKMTGDKGLMRMLEQLPDAAQRKVVKQGLRQMAKDFRQDVIDNVPVDTGNLKQALQKTKVKVSKRSRSSIAMEYPLPARDLLGISPDDPFYYPVLVEYGVHGRQKASYIRAPVDSHFESEMRKFNEILRTGIPKEAERLAKK